MALEGKSSGKQAKKKGGKMDLDSLIAGANKIGEDVEDDDDDEGDLSDIDDEELLGELQVCIAGEGHRECGWTYGEGRVKARKLVERDERRVLGYLYVTPWVPRVLGLKQRDEVIIMNLGRDGGTHVNCHVMVM